MSKQMSIPLTHPENMSTKQENLYTLHKPYSFRQCIVGGAWFIEDGRGKVVAGVTQNESGHPNFAPQSEAKDMANFICHLLNEAAA